MMPNVASRKEAVPRRFEHGTGITTQCNNRSGQCIRMKEELNTKPI